jgi:hypothetical protein
MIYRAMMFHSNDINSHNHYHQYHIYRQLHYQHHSYLQLQHHSYNKHHFHHSDLNHLKVTTESPNTAKAGSSILMSRCSGSSCVWRRSLLVAHSSLPSKSSREQLVSPPLANYYFIHTYVCMYVYKYIHMYIHMHIHFI